MQRTYTIAKGHQYSTDGVRVKMTGERSDRWAEYSAAGVRESGDLLPEADLDLVEAAVRRVAETGATGTITLGESDAPVTRETAEQAMARVRLVEAMDNQESDL